MQLLVLGANSEIGLAVAECFARQERADLTLASRDVESLKGKASALAGRWDVKVQAIAFNARDTASHVAFYEQLTPRPDGVVVAFGYFGDQARGQREFPEAEAILSTNLTGAVSILERVAEEFEQRGHGFILAISSIAGVRGRKKHYLYGAAKGGFTNYLSGLRNRLAGRGILVMTILPGYVRTPMTSHLHMPPLLTATPERVAGDIFRGYRRGTLVLYTPWYWRYVMGAIRMLPERLFARLNI